MSLSIPVKTAEELEKMRRCGRILAEALGEIARALRPGIPTAELDRLAETVLRDAGAVPAFNGYRGYPANVCVSINEEVVHGIPGARILKEGDLVGIDLGAIYDGYITDAAETFYIGEPPERVRRFMETSRRALHKGIERMRPGFQLGDISNAIQREVEAAGYNVVRKLVGHGIGKLMHEEPQVPNFGPPAAGPVIMEGMVFAIEPMVNMGTFIVNTRNDGWTEATADGSLSAHFEHTVAAAASGPEILTRLPGKDGSTFL